MVFIKDQSVIQCKNTNEIIKCFKNIFNTYENNYNVYGLLGGFYSLLSSFAGNIVRKNQILTKAVSYIHNNYSTIKSVFEIADYVFLSRSQLYRIFMNQLSRSPQEYLIDYRISRAQDLLEAGVLSVEDISKRCGFNNATHFSNTFKKKTGLSPLKYQSVREGGLGFFYAPVK
jgi:AraC family transcriptional regulator of arabinose operon